MTSQTADLVWFSIHKITAKTFFQKGFDEVTINFTKDNTTIPRSTYLFILNYGLLIKPGIIRIECNTRMVVSTRNNT